MVKEHRRGGVLTLAIVINVATIAALPVDKHKAVYHGGTISGDYKRVGGTKFPPRKVRPVRAQYGLNVSGTINTTSESEFVFDSNREGSLSIPYRAIVSIIYGPDFELSPNDKQTSQYPWSRYFHRSRSYLGITFEDYTGVEESAVFQLGSDIVRPTLQVLETRTRKQVQLQTILACDMYKSAEECGWSPVGYLKGRKKVFIDAESRPNNRERIIEELTKARLGVELQAAPADAEIILHFDGEFGMWLYGYPRTNFTRGRATGEVYVVHDGRLRTIVIFDELWEDWRNRAVGFAREFVKAYTEAHRVK